MEFRPRDTRLTFDPGIDGTPVWTSDGRRIVFSSPRGGSAPNLYWQPADGTGTVERLTESPNAQSPISFSRDGSRLVIRETLEGTNAVSAVSLDGERRTAPLVQTPFNDNNGVVSPDGGWLAYQSNESGQFQIYVRPFPNVDEGRWQVSTDGGSRPLWARSGRELFYLGRDERIMAVPIQGGPAFAAGTPEPLPVKGPYFLPPAGTFQGRTYDVSPDGRRFLLIKQGSETGDAPPLTQFVVVRNWFEELERLVRMK